MATNDTHLSAADLWDLVNLRSEQAEPGADKGMLGKNGAAMIIKNDNTIVDSASLYAQRITSGDAGCITDTSLQHNISTVRANINCSDFTINGHKLNSYMYEITNMKQVQETAVGNFTVSGTVLVKTYDPNLGKWVFIRRQVRVPMFGNILDPFAIDERICISSGKYSTYQYKIDKDDGEE
jgi:hypothetical protein